jgi:hypothetical protein
MKITHQIDFHEREDEVLLICKGMGLKIDERFSRIRIAENDERWPAVRTLKQQYRHFETCDVRYTLNELANARWLRIGPAWHHGYPMPDTDFGYLGQTYNLSGCCNTCSTGAIQNRPFRMAKEPKWGRRCILQLHWVYDEFFVTPAAWSTVFKPFGIDRHPVLHHRTGKELETVVQLKIDALLEGPVDVRDLEYELCQDCGQKKYHPIVECGYSPPIVGTPAGAQAVKSRDIFGSGGKAFREIYFSQDLFQAIQKASLKGAEFYPVGESES